MTKEAAKTEIIDDILYNVFRFLDSKTLGQVVPQVAKQWHRLANDNTLWKEKLAFDLPELKQSIEAEATAGGATDINYKAAVMKVEKLRAMSIAELEILLQTSTRDAKIIALAPDLVEKVMLHYGLKDLQSEDVTAKVCYSDNPAIKRFIAHVPDLHDKVFFYMGLRKNLIDRFLHYFSIRNLAIVEFILYTPEFREKITEGCTKELDLALLKMFFINQAIARVILDDYSSILRKWNMSYLLSKNAVFNATIVRLILETPKYKQLITGESLIHIIDENPTLATIVLEQPHLLNKLQQVFSSSGKDAATWLREQVERANNEPALLSIKDLVK